MKVRKYKNESIKDATEGYEMTGQTGTDIFTGETMIEYVKKLDKEL
jgi:hypothetical protein